MNLVKNILFSLSLISLSCFSFVGIAQAEAAFKWSQQKGMETSKEIGTAFGAQSGTAGGASNLTTTIGKVIQAALSVLGIIFVIILIVAGFRYMLATGDEQTKEALNQIKNSIIGLIIVISAYAIAEFVITSVSK